MEERVKIFAKPNGSLRVTGKVDIVDADGNTLLDLCGTELNPLGYNHDAFVRVI